MTCHCNPEHKTEKRLREIAAKLGVCERTIWRDVATLELLYESLGTSLLDN